MKTLYAHQQRFIDRNPDRALLVWETGTGKSLAACRWLKKREGRGLSLIVCPKALVAKWHRDLFEERIDGFVVLTRDQVKKVGLSQVKNLVIDEAQDFSSPLFSKMRSARATKIYNHLKENPDTHVLLLTATPVRSTPWNIHTLACYLGILWDVRKFRSTFEYMTDMFGRMHYELRPEWRKMVRPYVEEISDIVLMRDCIDVPTQHEQTVEVPEEKMVMEQYESPSAEWYARHRHEQVVKVPALRKILDGYRKCIVVCNYTEQISHYSKELGAERQVFVLQGSTKNPDDVIEAAKAADDGLFIIQASMGAGFDASEFSVVVFASLSFRYVDYVQMKGRVKRINNLHENLFIHILAGKCDRAVYDAIMRGTDFDVHYVPQANNL